MKKIAVGLLVVVLFSGCGFWKWLSTEPEDTHPDWPPMEPTRPWTNMPPESAEEDKD